MIWFPGLLKSLSFELSFAANNLARFSPLLLGLLVYLPAHILVVRRWPWIRVLGHELTHALFAILFLRRVTEFVVSSKGGYVCHVGSAGGEFGNSVISLSPYFFPTITITMLLLRPWIGDSCLAAYDIGIGCSLAYHTATSISETIHAFRKRYFTDVSGEHSESDTTARGSIFSAIFIAFFFLFFNGLILAQIRDGYDGSWQFIKTVALIGKDDMALLVRSIFSK